MTTKMIYYMLKTIAQVNFFNRYSDRATRQGKMKRGAKMKIANKKIVVNFEGGESTIHPTYACNYMSAKITESDLKAYDIDADGDFIELYAEHILSDSTEDECEGYDELKRDIIEQAKRVGLPIESLKFFYD